MKYTTLFSAVAMAATALPSAEARSTRGQLRSLDALEESFGQVGHGKAARRQLKSKSKGSKGVTKTVATKTVEVKSWNVTPFCGASTSGFDPIADAAEFCATKGKSVPTEEQVCGYNMQTPLVFDRVASTTGTVDIGASCPKAPHTCAAYTPAVEDGEVLDPDMVTPSKCQMKRKDWFLTYEPSGPSVFPADRPDIFVEVLIPSTRQIIPFYREDRYIQYVEGRIPFDQSLQDDIDLYWLIFNEQEGNNKDTGALHTGGQMGFKLRYNGKRGPGAWNSCSYSPIAFDLNGDGVVSHITDDVEGFRIDITGDGDIEHLSEWFAKEEGILVDLHDENGMVLTDFTDGSGTITGNHLMGDMAGKYTDGFAKLATYDDNCDDKLTGNELEGLYIWVDENSNMEMDTGELHELSDYGIVALNTVHDNLKSYALLDTGKKMLMQDLWFDAFEADRRLKSQELARRRQLLLADVVGDRSLEEDCDAAIVCSNEAPPEGESTPVAPKSLPAPAPPKTGLAPSPDSPDGGPSSPDSPSVEEKPIRAPEPSVDDPAPEPEPSPDSPSDEEPAPPAPDSPSPEDRTTAKAFTKGDPHFKTFGGELYDYHGECDLVLLHNPDFVEGMGMDIHIRTKIQDFWSSVESAAVKLGDQTMEIRADPSSSDWLWFNGMPAAVVDGEWNHHELSGFLVRYKQTGDNVREANIHIKGAKEVLVMKTFKSFVRIDIQWQGSEHYKNSVGLLGSHAHNGERLGRNGKLIQNVNTFGQEWQVRPEADGALFHSYEGAVVGQKCVMPPTVASSLRKRRLASGLDTADAEKACDHLMDPEEKKACVFDVIATQDLSMASTW